MVATLLHGSPQSLEFPLTDINSAAVGLTAQLNLQFTAAQWRKTITWVGSLATFEFGGRFRNSHKFDNSFSTDYQVPSGTILLPMNQFPSVLSNSSYYGGSYPLGPNRDYQDVLAAFNALMPGALFDSQHPPTGNNYNLIEKVSAGYLMNTIDFNSRIRFIAGVRFEGTNLDTSGPTFDSNGNFIGNTNGQRFVCKGAAKRFRPFRYYERYGCARHLRPRPLPPQPSDIAQAVTFTLGPPNTATLGNPNLKAETAQNFDVLVGALPQSLRRDTGRLFL